MHGGFHGPLFVNPYDPNQLFIMTNIGIQVSYVDINGNLAFKVDNRLTLLVTGFGKFPLDRISAGGIGGNLDVDASYRANPMSTSISHSR